MTTSCSICMEDILAKDKYITPCNHTFHKNCFAQLINANKKSKLHCPNCKFLLNKPVFDNELIQKEINDYLEEWDSDLNCDDLIEQINLTYGKTFLINNEQIKDICISRGRERGRGTMRKTNKKRNKRKTYRTKPYKTKPYKTKPYKTKLYRTKTYKKKTYNKKY